MVQEEEEETSNEESLAQEKKKEEKIMIISLCFNADTINSKLFNELINVHMKQDENEKRKDRMEELKSIDEVKMKALKVLLCEKEETCKC